MQSRNRLNGLNRTHLKLIFSHTFGFENGRHDVCEEASLVIWKVLSLLFLIDTCRIHESIGDGRAWKTALAILRSLSRDIENFPMSVTDVECQVIPFSTGYNSSLSEYRPECSVVSYAPAWRLWRNIISHLKGSIVALFDRHLSHTCTWVYRWWACLRDCPRWMSHTRGCCQYRYQYRDNRWQGHFPFYGNGSLSSMPITSWLYIRLTCHLALRLLLEHKTQQNTQVCIPKENCYIQSKMV
jgi:hypothetical protein